MNKVTRREAIGAVSVGIAALPTLGLAASTPRVEADGKGIRAYQVGDQKGLGSLVVAKRPDPTPGPGQVLVRVRAAALNRRDLSILSGRYQGIKPIERIPLGDGAGDVIAIGDGVSRVKVGDRVTAVHFTSWVDGEYEPGIFDADLGNSHDGWLTQKALLPADALVKLPDRMSYEDAAALTTVGVTAWSVIHTFGRVKPGDVVLTLGTGGVSMMALQLARMAGARVAITSSSDEKLETARAHGADITVNYRTSPDWDRKVLEATAGRGADIVVETAGVSTLGKSIAASAPNARIGLVGALGGASVAPPNLGALILKNGILKGITSGSRRMLEHLHRAVEANGIRPIIDKVFDFEDAPAAYAYLDKQEHIGKVVIRFA